MLQKQFLPRNLSWHHGPELSQTDLMVRESCLSSLVSLDLNAEAQRTLHLVATEPSTLRPFLRGMEHNRHCCALWAVLGVVPEHIHFIAEESAEAYRSSKLWMPKSEENKDCWCLHLELSIKHLQIHHPSICSEDEGSRGWERTF